MPTRPPTPFGNEERKKFVHWSHVGSSAVFVFCLLWEDGLRCVQGNLQNSKGNLAGVRWPHPQLVRQEALARTQTANLDEAGWFKNTSVEKKSYILANNVNENESPFRVPADLLAYPPDLFLL